MTFDNGTQKEQLQKELIDDIKKSKNIKEARLNVYQTIQDIETDALVKTGKDSSTIDIDKREKVDTRINVVKTPIIKYLDILDKTHDMMYSLIGHQTQKSKPAIYEKEHVDYTESYRIEILEGLSQQQKSMLFKDLSFLGEPIDDFLDIMENVQEATKKEEEALQKNE